MFNFPRKKKDEERIVFNTNQCAYCGYYRNPKSIKTVIVDGHKVPGCLVCINDIKNKLIGEIPFSFAHHPLNPEAPLHDKLNFKKHLFIERDGSIIQSVRLSAEQNLREEIILNHVVGQLSSIGYINKQQEFEITSRDAPWDFNIKTKCGREFNIEITEFTDSKNYRQMNEEKELEFRKLFSAKRAPYIKIKKAVEYLSMEDINLPEISKGDNKTLIENPLFGKEEPRFFISISGEMKKNIEAFKYAILKKTQKKHGDKDNTILVLDNRSIYFNSAHYEEILEWAHDNKPNIPFKEIFVYTGYYSNDDGRYSEFSIMSLMLNEEISDYFADSGVLEKQKDWLVDIMTSKKWYGK